MKHEDGFTLPELLVALALSVGLVIALVFVSKPRDFTALEQHAERRTNIARIVQGLQRYKADKGALPANMPTKVTPITVDTYDLCDFLVPTYLKDIPVDPRHGIKTMGEFAETDEPCSADGVFYYTGYTIVRNQDGSATVSEEEAIGDPISLTL
jgi:prepilin-type N-terminal cleavage/methylation domain-containing protein